MTQHTTPRESMDTIPNADQAAQGEGNIDADRRYRAGVEKTVQSGKVEELAEDAREALEGPEGEALRKAEQKGKKGEHGPS